MTDEETMLRKALKKPGVKGYHRKIPFYTTEKLIDDLTTLYPTLNELFIYNHDLRDRENGPVLTCKNHRALKALITTTKGYRGVSHSFEAKWQACFVAVENKVAYVKIAQLSVGGIR
ncbi:hypothetical protein KAU55_00560 [Candidatus Bathyarchaeota archaeon]|nr:hypothetical protein [Candidatus Bathyarchaeota archaeon]